MNPVLSSTFFTVSPHWQWLIVFYFFLGGLAGGSYFLAALIDTFGRSEDRPLARIGYLVAFPCIAMSGVLLSVDLGRPLRFWHMLIQRNTFEPMFKPWSPMSIGSWALAIFGLFATISFVLALVDSGLAPSWVPRVRVANVVRRAVAIVGGIFGFYVAGYTGVLLSVTNRPIWSDTPLLGMLFIVSAASTSAALMILLAHRAGWRTPGVADLHRLDAWMIAFELLVLIATIVSLGPVMRAWVNVWGALLLVGVILCGLVVPLLLTWRPGWLRDANVTATAVFVLVGGFLLRYVIVFSSESI
jgi:formate-dependent nitrite reductase membrane component NrfD